MKVGFIGTGNMGGALIRGYAKAKDDCEIYIFDKNPKQTEKFKDIDCVVILDQLDDLIEKADIIILALKPNIFEKVLPAIKNYLKVLEEISCDMANKIFVSIAAGISIDYMSKELGDNVKIVRVMPNLTAMVGLGMTGMSRKKNVSEMEFQCVKEIFTSVGKATEINEGQMDTVTGISGSSPAYAFMFIEALIDCAEKNGMSREDAKVFASQSTLGAAVTVMESGIEPAELTHNVCSPGGTTIEAVEKLRSNGFQQNVEEAMNAAIEKSRKMTK